jgi:hypothetical protein
MATHHRINSKKIYMPTKPQGSDNARMTGNPMIKVKVQMNPSFTGDIRSVLRSQEEASFNQSINPSKVENLHMQFNNISRISKLEIQAAANRRVSLNSKGMNFSDPSLI